MQLTLRLALESSSICLSTYTCNCSVHLVSVPQAYRTSDWRGDSGAHVYAIIDKLVRRATGDLRKSPTPLYKRIGCRRDSRGNYNHTPPAPPSTQYMNSISIFSPINQINHTDRSAQLFAGYRKFNTPFCWHMSDT